MFMPESWKPIIGLALSGGAARGLAHIAVLKTLEEEGVPIHAIAGTSAGSVVGALYCAGMPLSQIEHILVHAKWTDILKLTIPKQGLISSEGIYRFLEDILPIKKFSALPLPLAVVATDLKTAEKIVITNGSIARAVQASCSVPILFTPTELGNKVLVDGGVSSQIPVRAVREELGARRVIAVNVNYKAMESDHYDNMINIATHLSALWASKNAREEEKLADVSIDVNAKGIAIYDLSRAKELLRRGRKATLEKLKQIVALVD
jgi:NTE family protein